MLIIGKKKTYILDKSQSLLLFFFLITKMNSYQTYGDFRVEFLRDDNGGKIKINSLFLNLYDLWCLCRDGFLLGLINLVLHY